MAGAVGIVFGLCVLSFTLGAALMYVVLRRREDAAAPSEEPVEEPGSLAGSRSDAWVDKPAVEPVAEFYDSRPIHRNPVMGLPQMEPALAVLAGPVAASSASSEALEASEFEAGSGSDEAVGSVAEVRLLAGPGSAAARLAAGPELVADAERAAGRGLVADAEQAAGPELVADAERAAGAESLAEAELVAEAERAAELELVAETELAAEAGLVAEAELAAPAGSVAEPEPLAGPEPVAAAEPVAESGPIADPEPGAEAETVGAAGYDQDGDFDPPLGEVEAPESIVAAGTDSPGIVEEAPEPADADESEKAAEAVAETVVSTALPPPAAPQPVERTTWVEREDFRQRYLRTFEEVRRKAGSN